MEITKNKIKEISTISAGTILQWYDFSLFGLLAVVISNQFFPANDPEVTLLYTYCIFAVSFILGPLGSLIFGYIGDTYGRKRSLVVSVAFMLIPTILISIVPTYETIGIWAPIILIMARLIQGFVASSEYVSASVFLVEQAPNRHKALYGCISGVSYNIGCMLGALAVSIATLELLPDWAWRITYAISALGIILLYYMRNNTSETDDFVFLSRQKSINKLPIMAVFQHNKLKFFCSFILAGFIGVTTYGTFTYMVSYMNIYSPAQISLSQGSSIILLGLVLDGVLEPYFANIADKIGHYKFVYLSIATFIFAIPVIFLLINNKSIFVVLAGFLMLFSLTSATCAAMPAFMVTSFPAECRCSGYSLAFNLGITIFGSTTPMILTILSSKYDYIIAPIFYYVFFSALALITVLILVKESRNQYATLS